VLKFAAGAVFDLVGFFERGNTGDKEKEIGNEERAGDGEDRKTGKVRKRVDEDTPPNQDFAEVVGVARVFPKSGGNPEIVVFGVGFEKEFLLVGDGFDQETGEPDGEAGDHGERKVDWMGR